MSRSEWGAGALAMCRLDMLGYARNSVERNIAVGALARGWFELLSPILILAHQICSKSAKEEGLKEPAWSAAVLYCDVILAFGIVFLRL